MTDTGTVVHAPHTHGNVLTRKVGPLPGWAWVGIAVAGYLAYRWYSNKQASSGTPINANAGTSPANSGKGPGFRGHPTINYTHPPIKTVTYTTQHNDTLGGISLRFYGTDQFWHDIRAHNRAKVGTKGKGDVLRPGIKLVIPRDHPVR